MSEFSDIFSCFHKGLRGLLSNRAPTAGTPFGLTLAPAINNLFLPIQRCIFSIDRLAIRRFAPYESLIAHQKNLVGYGEIFVI